MKILAKVLTVITLLAVLLAGYVVWKADATVSSEGYRVEAAADRADEFNAIVSAYQRGDDSIVAYSADQVGGTDQYVFITYTIKVKNADLIAMEWLDLTLNSQPGDVLLVKSAAQDVPALGETYVSVTLMADRSIVSYERQATLSYYIYGHYKEISVTLI